MNNKNSSTNFSIEELNRKISLLQEEKQKFKNEMIPLQNKYRDLEIQYNNLLRKLEEKGKSLKSSLNWNNFSAIFRLTNSKLRRAKETHAHRIGISQATSRILSGGNRKTHKRERKPYEKSTSKRSNHKRTQATTRRTDPTTRRNKQSTSSNSKRTSDGKVGTRKRPKIPENNRSKHWKSQSSNPGLRTTNWNYSSTQRRTRHSTKVRTNQKHNIGKWDSVEQNGDCKDLRPEFASSARKARNIKVRSFFGLLSTHKK